MSHKPFVCVVESLISTLCSEIDLERSILSPKADVLLTILDDPDHVPAEISRADALIVSHYPRISAGILARLANARVIVRNGVGFDNIDGEAAERLGIPVCNVPDYGTEEVAEHALLLTLALERRLLDALHDVRAGRWDWKVAIPGRRLRGQRFGIVGCGRIGTAAGLRAKAFGFRVQFYDPYVASGYEKAVGLERLASLPELLETSDVVSLHTPLTPETHGMIGAAELALMKPGAFLINTARGPLIEEQALVAALRSGRLGGVALDVVEHEPDFAPELTCHPNCLMTPHIAFYSEEALYEMRANAARIVLRVLEGGSPYNVVNGVSSARTTVEDFAASQPGRAR